jgi:2-polyprenyl-6-methoxyphenol hydroxylase-like FAD-dependent oxidoreductase
MNSTKAPLSVAIIGGGMGGLAAACAMGRAGLKVDIFEQAPAFGEVGAGLKSVRLEESCVYGRS